MFVKRVINKPLVFPNIDKMEEDYNERMAARKKQQSRNSILGMSKLGNILSNDFEGTSFMSPLDKKLARE